MRAPSSTRTAPEVWGGKDIELVIEGRAHLNGSPFSETFLLHIDRIEEGCSIVEAITEAITAAAALTSIPADLVEGILFKFIPKS